ncbi:MAG: dihydroxyacetone kinase subunit DhaL [Armatimonadota bacterium]
METLTKNDIMAIIRRLGEKMPEHKEQLRELDAQLGDGDLGVTIELGTEAMAAGVDELSDQDTGMVLARSGMTFNQAGASTFGAIFATALMSAGKQIQDQDEFALADLAEMFDAAIEGVKERGGAEQGEKTILDVLIPMRDALREALEDGLDLQEAIFSAHEACQTGLEATKEMEGKYGRAGWLKDRSVGVQDPGSTAICLMWGYVCQYMKEAGS